MKYIGIALIYLGFFALIAFSTWWTKSAWCLWALLLTPNYKEKHGKADVS